MKPLDEITEADIAALTEGPKTDALVAEATGQTFKRPDKWLSCVWHRYSKHPEAWGPYQPSTDHNAAAEATMHISEETGWRLCLDISATKTSAWWTGDGCPLDRGDVRTADAEPLARCKAVLLAAVMRRQP